MCWVIGAGLAVLGGFAGYLWHRRTDQRKRRFGAVILILLPGWLVIAMMALSEWLPSTHWLNIWGPDGSALTPLEAAMLLTMLWAPGWVFGFIGGYMTQSIQRRPLRF